MGTAPPNGTGDHGGFGGGPSFEFTGRLAVARGPCGGRTGSGGSGLRTRAIPASAAAPEPTLLIATWASAAPYLPASTSCTVSTEYVLKVVNEPQNPVPTSSLARGGSAVDATTAPSTKLPARFTSVVGHGCTAPRRLPKVATA